MFTRDVQCLPAGRKYADVGGILKNIANDLRGFLDQVLTTIQNDKPPARQQKIAQRLLRIDQLRAEPDCGSNRPDEILLVGYGRKIDKECRAGEVGQRPVPDCQGNRCFADAARTQNCNQALSGPAQPLNLKDNIVATDHAAQRGRQVGHSRRCIAPVVVRGKASDRRDEAVALALQARNVLAAELTVAQRLAQRRQMDAKTALLDRDVRPCPRDQFGFPDNFTGVFEQRDQNVVGPATQRNDLARLLQCTLGDIEFEWAKPKPDCTG